MLIPRRPWGYPFPVPQGVALPASLKNIYKELMDDLPETKLSGSGDLTHWAEQGALLLNTALTVRCQKKETHLDFWKDLTDALIQLISQKSPTPVVFILWGAFAKNKKSLIAQPTKHLIIEGTHPSPLGAIHGGFFGGKYFSKTNEFLTKHQIEAIDWSVGRSMGGTYGSPQSPPPSIG